MRTSKFILSVLVTTSVLLACSEESDMALTRVASPVVVDLADINATSMSVVFYELDKTGILDQTVGIDSIAVPDLSVEVFSSGVSLGMFTTGIDGAFVVDYASTKPNEFAGTHKGVAFRIKK